MFFIILIYRTKQFKIIHIKDTVKIVRSKAMIVILSSPSGGGKTSISKKILDNDNNIELSVSATTRKPRADEHDSIDYFFKKIDEFHELKESDEFIESAEVYGNFYGTPKEYVYKTLESGKDVLFDIDHQGAKQIKEKLSSQVVSIFIVPPSLEVLRERLENRGQDNFDDIEKRLKLAEEVISHSDKYDYVVVNDQFEQAVLEVEEIIKQERLKR